MLATVPSATVLGARGITVTVEAHVSQGLPGVALVGQPDTACREGLHRIRSAFAASGADWPQSRRITINLVPPGLRKLGSGLDAAIAVAVLVALGQLPVAAVEGLAFVGELGLDGRLRAVPGIVPMVGAAADGARAVVVPAEAAAAGSAAVAGSGAAIRPVARLADLLAALRGELPWPTAPPPEPDPDEPDAPDLADVRGQAVARHALEVAAAGGHHLLLVGPPGAGKTMLARRLPGLLPALAPPDALEVTAIWSAAGLGLPPRGLVRHAPFRAPHHAASQAAVIGGGSAWLRPGEVSCAHRGVLFLDEMGEFPTTVLDALRTPLEEGVVRVARAREAVELPARFLLVGATNPCPCGEGGPVGSCRCSPAARARYLRRLSGPLLDRFDLRVEVTRPTAPELLGRGGGEPSSAVAGRVAEARALAEARGVRCNAELSAAQLDRWAVPGEDAVRLVERAVTSGRLSARGVARARTVARTLADLEGHDAPVLTAEHVAAALALRRPLTAVEQRVAS